jgi:carnitine-CoA ligase
MSYQARAGQDQDIRGQGRARGGVFRPLEVLPIAERTIGHLLRQAANRYGERTFLQWRAEAFTYRDMNRRANRVANAFRELGVSKGTRVAIFISNRVEYLDIWFGLAKLGAIELPINTAYKAPQILQTLSRAEVPVVVVQADLAVEFELISGQLARCRHVVSLDGSVRGPSHAFVHNYETLVARASEAEPDVVVVGTDVGAIMNTSGTTGLAKGVLLPQAQQYWLGRSIANALELGEDDVYYNFFPLFHNTAQAMIALPVLLTGGRMVLTEKFSLSSFWPDVHKHKITVFYYIGEILHLLVKNGTPAKAEGSKLRAGWGIGGSPSDVDMFEKLYGARLGTGYGSTEGNVPIFRPLGAQSNSAAAGKCLPEFEVRVVDTAGQSVPTGEAGEIVIRSTEPGAIMIGYDGNPQASEEALKGGWYHSGDAGRFDADGNLYFVARIKDVIRVRGENISAFEIEDALLSFPDVIEAAAIAVPADIGGDDVKAVIVPAPGVDIELRALLIHCEHRLPKFSVPRYIELCRELPKTLTNKIQKHALREDGLNARTWDSRTGSFISPSANNQRGKS